MLSVLHETDRRTFAGAWHACGMRLCRGNVSSLNRVCVPDTGANAQIWFLPVVATMFIASELAVLRTTDVQHLWLVSASLGLAYGALFNVLPMLVLEWFGMGERADSRAHKRRHMSASKTDNLQLISARTGVTLRWRLLSVETSS